MDPDKVMWIAIRRALLLFAAAIEKRWGLNPNEH